MVLLLLSQDLATDPHHKPDESYSENTCSFLKTCFNIIIPSVPFCSTIPRVDFTSTLGCSPWNPTPNRSSLQYMLHTHPTVSAHDICRTAYIVTLLTTHFSPSFLPFRRSLLPPSSDFFLLSRFKQQISLELCFVGYAGKKNTSTDTTVANNVCVYRVRF